MQLWSMLLVLFQYGDVTVQQLSEMKQNVS
jgi:hypothetical protein